MTARNRLFSSESVSMGHPDKVADQISDGILDALIGADPNSRVACETMVTTGMAVVAGEITTEAYADIPEIVRNTIAEIGYTEPELGFAADTCAVITSIDKQSADISQGVTQGQGLHKDQGAGDQGIMFGFACTETKEYMPLPIALSNRLMRALAKYRVEGRFDFVKPDSKSQVTVEYGPDGAPKRVHTVVISTQHSEDIPYEELKERIVAELIKEVIPAELLDGNTIYHVNPTGRFVKGGPAADCGLTGRKIVVDGYGGYSHVGGGAFSGKDPSKVDRSAAYAARHLAKNVVAAGLAPKCEVQLAYAIGVAQPLSIFIDTHGTALENEDKIEKVIRECCDLRPSAIIENLKLRKPIFKQTARYGHFGIDEDAANFFNDLNLDEYTWEKLDLVDQFKDASCKM